MIFKGVELKDSGMVSVIYDNDGTRHRRTVNPGDDVTDLPIETQAEINDHWTPERVATWQAAQDEALGAL